MACRKFWGSFEQSETPKSPSRSKKSRLKSKKLKKKLVKKLTGPALELCYNETDSYPNFFHFDLHDAPPNPGLESALRLPELSLIRSRTYVWGIPLRVVVRTRQETKKVVVVQANGVTQIPELVSQLPELVSSLPEGLSNVQGWDGEKLGLSAAGLLYLTAKPGVLLAALDSFIAAPFQTVIEFVRGRRSWKRLDFVVDECLGKGSFGTMYTGVILLKNMSDDDELETLKIMG